MEKIILRKVGAGFVPVNDPAREFFDKTKLGQEISVKANRDRNLAHHRKAFSLLHVVFQSQEIFDTEEKLRLGLTYMSGYVDSMVVAKNGDTVMIPKSWAFNSMSQEEFNELYESLKTEALKLLPSGWTNEQLDNAVLEITSF